MTNTELFRIENDHVVAFDRKNASFVTVPADYVVLSLGVRPVNSLAKELESTPFKVVSVGDCARAGGTIADAVAGAYEVCKSL